MAAPAPFRSVRRESGFLVMLFINTVTLGMPTRVIRAIRGCCRILYRISHLKWRAPDDTHNNAGKPVIVARRLVDNRTHCGHVMVVEAAAQRISQHLLAQR